MAFLRPRNKVCLFVVGSVAGHWKVEQKEWAEDLIIKVNKKKLAQASSAGQVALKGSTIGPMAVVMPGTSMPAIVGYLPRLGSLRNECAATTNRYACKMPEPERKKTMPLFVEFCQMMTQLLIPVGIIDEDVPTYEHALQHSNYSGTRINYLSKVRTNVAQISRKTCTVQSFLKEEVYDKPKNARAINSPSDDSKVLLTAICHAVDKLTFKIKHFVKGTNPKTWMERIYAELGDNPVVATDFTAFESHHRGDFSYVIYYWFAHCTRSLTGSKHLRRLVKQLMLGTNVNKFKNCDVEIDQRLMSGALWTSSANGYLNLMIMMFLSAPLGPVEDMVRHTQEHFAGFVEGDDGLCKNKTLDEQRIKDLGLVLKPEPHSSCLGAGFCGIICDNSTMTPLKDPRSFLRKFFLHPRKYADASEKKKKTLIRAKALSNKYTFGNCPIIGAVCDWALRVTSSYDVRGMQDDLDRWHRDALLLALAEKPWKDTANPSDVMRVLVEENFNVSVADQLRIEESFKNSNEDVVECDLRTIWNNTDLENLMTYVVDDLSKFVEPPLLHTPAIDAIISAGGLKPGQVFEGGVLRDPPKPPKLVRSYYSKMTNMVEPEQGLLAAFPGAVHQV